MIHQLTPCTGNRLQKYKELTCHRPYETFSLASSIGKFFHGRAVKVVCRSAVYGALGCMFPVIRDETEAMSRYIHYFSLA